MDRLLAMEIFVRVADCGSFSRAAESLDLSNATVTTSVRNLERHLGVTLINRDTRRLRVTEEGRSYLEGARELLEGLVRAEEAVRAQKGELRGRLHIESTISLGRELLRPRLPEFIKRYPEITAMVTLSNQQHNVIERAIDVAIRIGHVDGPELVARPIYGCRYVMCCAPGLAEATSTHPRQLDPRRCIGGLRNDRRSILPWALQKGDEEFEIRPEGPLHFNSNDDMLEAAQAGVGVTCVLDLLASRYFSEGTLVPVCPEWTTAVETLYVVIPKSRVGSAKVKAFTDFLFEVVGELYSPNTHQRIAFKPSGKRAPTPRRSSADSR